MNQPNFEASVVFPAPEPVQDQNGKKYVTFFVSEREYAVPATVVNEVTQKAASTRLPNSSDYLLGIVPIRGEIAALIDLKKALGETPSRSERNKTLVLKSTGISTMPLAFDIDRIGELRIIPHSEIHPSEVSREKRVVAGVANIAGSALTVIDCDRLIGLLSYPA